MRTNLKTVLLASVLMTTFGAAAEANDQHQVWRDSDGQVVQNSWGACVRSSVDAYDDVCAPRTVVLEQKRTIVAEAERTVYFGFNQAELTPDSKTRLDALAEQLTSSDDVTGAKVVGYADRIGTASYNEALSKKRAHAVSDYMISRGFIKPSSTEMRWVGKSEPTASCPAKMSHDQLVSCLAPDRKVTVELQYQAEVQASR